MGITRTVQKPASRTLRDALENKRTREIAYLCSAAAATDSEDAALSAVNIDLGDAWPTDATTVCTERTATKIADKVFEVRLKYETKPQDADENSSDPTNPNPLPRPVEMTMDYEGQQAPLETAYNLLGHDVTPLDGAGVLRAVANTAGGDFAHVPMGENPVYVLRITRNEATFPSASAVAYTGRTNEAAWNGGAKWTWKCRCITGQFVFEPNSQSYWRVTYHFAYNARTWVISIRDRGQFWLENIDGQYTKVFPTDKRKIPSNAWVNINGEGGPLNDNLAQAGVFKYQHYLEHQATAFSSLFAL